MHFSITFFILFSFLVQYSSSTPFKALNGGSSLSVQKANETLISPNGVFSAGFYPIGDNAFIFAVWFTLSRNRTVIWTPNRDQPVNGKHSKLSLRKNGNMVLTDAGKNIVWDTSTSSSSFVQLSLQNTGNLVITNSRKIIVWQSFEYPTNTLLPEQSFNRFTSLVSSRSQSNYSSGFYKLFFDNDNVLKLLYDGPEVSSIYWPDPWKMVWDAGRKPFNSSKIAILDSYGHFTSSDKLEFDSSDFGPGPKRRLTLDFDGCLRLYSLDDTTGDWAVTWQSTLDPCGVHGICGPNSICSYASGNGRGCSCLPGYEARNSSDLSYGCKLEQKYYYEDDYEVNFVSVSHLELYGYEYDVFMDSTLQKCKEKCSNSSVCKGFLIKFEGGVYNCYAKSQLLNGKHSPNLIGTLYVKLNVSRRSGVFSNLSIGKMKINCSEEKTIRIDRVYKTDGESKLLNFLVYFASAIGVIEMIIILVASFAIFKTPRKSDQTSNEYFLTATGFRRFSNSELKRATRGFNEEIGRGGNGVVYRGILPDNRVAAIKRLNETSSGEVEFLAELSIIGRLNHMNLIEMWGYCIEGKHKILVSEYMENGSLAENLYSNKLDWNKRFNIAVGIAKGLAYLHEECLEWVLHCDVKPGNILLDSNYQPKVADFGLSKLLNRKGFNSNFSTIRGTRGYMAPEWIFNLPITSKVDVYSYGIIVLEMITGKSPMEGEEEEENQGLVTCTRNKMERANLKGSVSWVEAITDPNIVCGELEISKIQILVKVAMQCVDEDKDARPSMRQVVEMLAIEP